jgi:hypothetical protein
MLLKAKLDIMNFKMLFTILGMGVFFILGIKILLDFLYVRGVLVMVCSGILSLLLFQKITIGAWVQVAIVIAVAVTIITEIAKI